jgi:hypothetical protein
MTAESRDAEKKKRHAIAQSNSPEQNEPELHSNKFTPPYHVI